ncbi:hypothetical protein NYR70_04185 [Actinobacillus equuli subsp. equuli]|nr:hypothetical protein [Actinobacillus equuli]WGE47155.1 hypothetical protein NYR84_02880 [Actinobacillus equuli subsp. haemolyticus]WGE55884.1 hypothetical protein NYR70_04185 [Actinobacillus equuli subsp. equuli]
MTKQIQFTKTGSPDVLQIVDVQIPAPQIGRSANPNARFGAKGKNHNHII